jgi:hypothetical protein
MCTTEFYFAPRRLSAPARQGDARFPERSSGTRLIGTLWAEHPKACLRKIVALACNICRPRVLHGLARQDWRPIAAPYRCARWRHRGWPRPLRFIFVVIVIVVGGAFIIVGIDIPAPRAGLTLVFIIVIVVVVHRWDGLRRVRFE